MNKRLERGAGILLPVSSLPSPYGIGSFGKSAYVFIDQLSQAGMKYWQVLPIGPTSFGDSPYQSFSTFAGNPYFIDLDILINYGLLESQEVKYIDWGNLLCDVDYKKMYDNRYRLLKKAYLRFDNENEKFKAWKDEQKEWLDEYALFMACKGYFDDREWLSWPEDIRCRKESAITYYKEFLKEKIDFWKFIQYEFFIQWAQLKEYANKKKIKIIGDIPIYVALDSADVWCNTSQYQLDTNLNPINVAGCPPDAFSDYGQKWGNPIYDWEKMGKDNFSWWKRRIKAAAGMYDVIRIDHFIGVVRYFAIPVNGIPIEGKFCEGPGYKLTQAIDEVVGDARIIAEDLGVVVPGVKELLEKEGYPGMKILQFAFDGNRHNEYLPHEYEKNCVVYSGTHDNETLLGYLSSIPEKGKKYLNSYVVKNEDESMNKAVIRMAYSSVADVVITQMQDILQKDNSARMNLPSTIGQNWRWRIKEGEFDENIEWLRQLSDIYARTPE